MRLARALACAAVLGCATPLAVERLRARSPRRLAVRPRAGPGDGGAEMASPDAPDAAVATLLRAAGASDESLGFLPPDVGGDTRVLEYLLEDAGFTAADLAPMVAACPALAEGASPEGARAAVEYLDGAFRMRRCDLRRVVRSEPAILLRAVNGSAPIFDTGACPAILATASGGPAAGPKRKKTARLEDTVLLLKAVGCRAKHVRDIVVKWPRVLSLEMAQMLAITDFLHSLEFEGTLGSLYRSAPWLLAQPVDVARAAAAVLVDEVGVRRLEVVVRAYPRVLASTREELLAPLALLGDLAGVDDETVPAIVEAFPLLFGLDTIEPVLRFLLDEIAIAPEDAPRVVRAFPSLLGVDVAEARAVADFLRGAGIQNVARFVTRLPPVLAYDVEGDLRPKLAHLAKSPLSVYDVVRFPAYFSYPLATVIAPRTAFVQSLGVPLTRFSLAALLTPSDRDFARRLLGIAPGVYAGWKEDFIRPKSGPDAAKGRRREPAEALSPRVARSMPKAFPAFKPGAPETPEPPPPEPSPASKRRRAGKRRGSSRLSFDR